MSACLVAVDIAQSDENSAGEFRIVRHELADHGMRDAVPDADIRSAASARRGDDIGHAVAGDVADRDADSAAESGIVGREADASGVPLAASKRCTSGVLPASAPRPSS